MLVGAAGSGKSSMIRMAAKLLSDPAKQVQL